MDWQNLTVIAILGAATTYLARVAWLNVARRKTACGGCDRCAGADASAAGNLVGLDELAASATQRARLPSRSNDAPPVVGGPRR
jgi:hypothetical protein